MKIKERIKATLIAIGIACTSGYAFAQLASAMDTFFYHDDPNGYISMHLTYQEATNTYTEQLTYFNQSGQPTNQTTYANLSEYSTGLILEDVLGDDSEWFEES